jgi:hypothetical protein
MHQMETPEQLRSKLVSLCVGTKLDREGVHTVTFQPLKSRVNQDHCDQKVGYRRADVVVLSGMQW